MRLVVASLFVARAVHADCTPQAAAKALTGATYVEFRKVKTPNTPTEPAVARRVSTTGNEVQLDGRRIELANVYVKTEHHDYANLALLVGCKTDAAATYDPRTACEKLDDDRADAKHELAVATDALAKAPGRDRERAEAMVKLAKLKIERAALQGRQQLCHQAHDDRNECHDNPLAKGCS